MHTALVKTNNFYDLSPIPNNHNMARIKYPSDLAAQQLLFKNLFAKNNTDGVNSPLIPFVTQQEINLANDNTAMGNAATHEANRVLFSSQSENYNQLRDNAFKVPFKHLKGEVQYLKAFFKGNVLTLGQWGINVTTGGRISYPPSFEDRAAMYNTFIAKHNSFAAGTSPLLPYLTTQSIDAAADTASVANAIDSNNLAVETGNNSENAREQRDLLWNPVWAHVKSMGTYLKKLYKTNPKNLGLWGFQVDDSPQKPAIRTSKLLAGNKVTVSGIVLGSTLANTGKTTLNVHKGGTTNTPAQEVLPGAEMGILKGFSKITVENTSKLESGGFTVTARQ